MSPTVSPLWCTSRVYGFGLFHFPMASLPLDLLATLNFLKNTAADNEAQLRALIASQPYLQRTI